jgi:hypothetical protein
MWSNHLSLKRFNSLDFSDFYKSINQDAEICATYGVNGITIQENKSTDPLKFTFTKKVWQQIKTGQMWGILHTHLKSCEDILSPSDIFIADTYGVDIACYALGSEEWDFFSPHCPHPYPLLLKRFNERPYEMFRSDCYRYIENLFSYHGELIPRIPRESDYYLSDSDFRLGNLSSKAGWIPTNRDLPVSLLVMQINNNYHFGLKTGNYILTFTRKGIRRFKFTQYEAYIIKKYRLTAGISTELQDDLLMTGSSIFAHQL